MGRQLELELEHGGDTLRLIGDDVNDIRVLWEECESEPELSRFFASFHFPNRGNDVLGTASGSTPDRAVAEVSYLSTDGVPVTSKATAVETVTPSDVLAAAPRRVDKSRSAAIADDNAPAGPGLRLLAERKAGHKLADNLTTGQAKNIIRDEHD